MPDDEVTRGPMASRFSLWWSSTEWRGRYTIREMAIAQDAFAHGWEAGAAVIQAAIDAGTAWGRADAVHAENPVNEPDPGPAPTVEDLLRNL
jgi:hypothetical protein